REGAPRRHPGSVERMKFPARGRAGGADGALGTLRLGTGKRLGGKGVHEIPAGDKLVVETPGGGGYGPAGEREPDRVLADVRSGLVSRAAAERDYGVVLDDDLTVDADATARLRGGGADDGGIG
ncbi:MAG: hydantoinase B/oxoprolinase family protein, partial [Proteobacteria bacterium]|nr:hydantoinase B/oxoprolinase family protein [Pseudomonadota bacterium]